MTRAEKRNAILAALEEDPSRSDREIARLVGCDGKTVAVERSKFRTAEIQPSTAEIEPVEIPHHADTAEIEIPHYGEVARATEVCPTCAEIELLHDPSKRTPTVVAKWLIETFPHAIDRIIGALQRQRDATSDESEIEINWEAGKAARDLTRIWSLDRLDQFREEITKGRPTRMTDTELRALWGSEKAPKSMSIPDDPVNAATKLWLYWGATPNKLTRLRYEIGRRTKAPEPPKPVKVWNPEEEGIPF
jgi:hypothetical protein